ncbi:MAG: hypothetical protein ACOVOR_02680 [Rhabdochlamydiaceae bacterium]
MYDYRIGVILENLILITQNQHFELGSKEENTQLLKLLKCKFSENYKLSKILIPNTDLPAEEKIRVSVRYRGYYNEESLKAAIGSGNFNYEYLLILKDRLVPVEKRDSFKTYMKDLEKKDSENKLKRFSLKKQFLESYRKKPNIYLTPPEEKPEEKLN